MLKVFRFEYRRWNEYEDAEDHGFAFTMAEDYSAAVKKITERLPNLYELHIYEMDDWDFLFVSEGLYDDIVKEYEGDGE